MGKRLVVSQVQIVFRSIVFALRWGPEEGGRRDGVKIPAEVREPSS